MIAAHGCGSILISTICVLCSIQSLAGEALPLARLEGSSGAVVAFDAAGDRLLTAGQDAARVWDVKTFKPLTEPLKQDQPLKAVAMSRDGGRVLTAVGNAAVLWDAQNGQRLRELRHPQTVIDVAFSFDGTRIATACFDGLARVWILNADKPIAELKHSEPVRSVSFSPDAKRLLTWTLLPVDYNPSIKRNSGKYELAENSPGPIHLWDIDQQKDLYRIPSLLLEAPGDYCEGVPVFSPSGDRFAVPRGQRGLELHETNSGKSLSRWLATTGFRGIMFTDFTRDGNRILAAGDDGSDAIDASVHVFELRPGEVPDNKFEEACPFQFEEVRGFLPNHRATAAAVSPDGKSVAIALYQDPFYSDSGLWDVATGEQSFPFRKFNYLIPRPDFKPPYRAVAFSPDGSLLAVAHLEEPDEFYHPAAGRNPVAYTTLWRVPKSKE